MKWCSSLHVHTPCCLLKPHKVHYITKTLSSLRYKHQAWRSLVCLNQSSHNPSARVQVLTLALLSLLPPPVLRDQPNAGVSDEQQRKEGDKNTNDCDLLLIVYHRVEKRWGKKHRTKSIANWIVFVWSRPASKKKKYKFYDIGHKWQWHNNLQRPVREADKPSLRELIDTNYSFLKLSPHWSGNKCQRGRGHTGLNTIII